MNINDLNEIIFNEIFEYLALEERVRCECVCRQWRSLLLSRIRYQRVIKFCMETSENEFKRPICNNRTHSPNSNDVIHLNTESIEKIDHLLTKFFNVKSIHIQSKDIKLLKKSNMFTCLSKYMDSIEHFEIDLFEGPFTRNDLQLLYKKWSQNLRHLVIRFETDLGKILNRRTIMKFFEIFDYLEVFYWKAPYLCEQNLEYTPSKLMSLHLIGTELDRDSFELLIQENKNTIKQLRFDNTTSYNLDVLTSNFLSLNLFVIDNIQLDDLSIGYDKLKVINRLDRLEVLRFILSNDYGHHMKRVDKSMCSIIRSCRLMKRAHIENALITDQSLTLISTYWKNLHSLKLYTHFDPDSRQITDQTIIELIKLDHLNTLALPNYSLSQNFFEQLIDRPKFSYLIIREPCDYVEELFNRMIAKATVANYNKYTLKICDMELYLLLVNNKMPANFHLGQTKYYHFDLF